MQPPPDSGAVAEALRALSAHPAFAEAHLRFQAVRRAEWGGLSQAERNDVYRAWTAAAELVPDRRGAIDRLAALRRLRSPEAVPLLTEVHRKSAAPALRDWAGYALLDVGTREALAAAEHGVTWFDGSPRPQTAVVAALRGRADGAYEVFAPACAQLDNPACEDLVAALLGEFHWLAWRRVAGEQGGQKVRAGGMSAQAWAAHLGALVEREPAFRDLAARLHQHPSLGVVARELLRGLSPDAARAALAPHLEPRRVILPGRAREAIAAAATNGGNAWDALVDLGELHADDLDGEVRAVAEDVMHRVRRNRDRLVERLHTAGYVFSEEQTSPAHDVERHLARLEALCRGRLPAALAAFMRIVGTLSFDSVWRRENTAPDWEAGVRAVVDSGGARAWASLFSDWSFAEEAAPEEWGEAMRLADGNHALFEPLMVPVGSDASGQNIYSVGLPSACADAVLQAQGKIFGAFGPRMGLVPYLRLTMKWGGFPGLETATSLPPSTRTLIAALTRDLEPF